MRFGGASWSIRGGSHPAAGVKNFKLSEEHSDEFLKFSRSDEWRPGWTRERNRNPYCAGLPELIESIPVKETPVQFRKHYMALSMQRSNPDRFAIGGPVDRRSPGE